MSQNGKLMPNLDQHSTKLLNLTVLQRIDPFVEEILITAAHVTFYEFNIDLSQWVFPPPSLFLSSPPFFSFFPSSTFLSPFVLQSRKDVEGSLFVVKRWSFSFFFFVYNSKFIIFLFTMLFCSGTLSPGSSSLWWIGETQVGTSFLHLWFVPLFIYLFFGCHNSAFLQFPFIFHVVRISLAF